MTDRENYFRTKEFTKEITAKFLTKCLKNKKVIVEWSKEAKYADLILLIWIAKHDEEIKKSPQYSMGVGHSHNSSVYSLKKKAIVGYDGVETIVREEFK